MLRSLTGRAKKGRRSCHVKAPPALEILTLKPYPPVPSLAETHSPNAKHNLEGSRGEFEAVLGRVVLGKSIAAMGGAASCTVSAPLLPPGPLGQHGDHVVEGARAEPGGADEKGQPGHSRHRGGYPEAQGTLGRCRAMLLRYLWG